jgi:hypothetical protein
MKADPILLSIAMIAAFALAIGGAYRLRVPADRFRGALMIVAALVLVGNALIWAIPI